MSELRDAIGAEAMTALSAIVGGRIVSVPHTFDPEGRLAQRVGPAIAAALIRHFGDSRVYVPRPAGSPIRPMDPNVVRRLTRKGWSADRIAAYLNVSTRAVNDRRRKLRLAGRL